MTTKKPDMSSNYQHLPISRALTLIFVFVSLLSIAVIFLMLQFLKDYTVEELAENEATKTAELIFQNLYTGMQKGWSKDDINSIISNIGNTIPDTDIKLFRSRAVEKMYGKLADEHHPPTQDAAVKQVFDTGEPLLLSGDEVLRYIYPLMVEPECLSCHSNTEVGQVNGIVSIALPLEKLRVPFEFTINSVIYIFLFSILSLGLMVYFAVRRLMVRPVEAMCEYMSDVSNSRDISRRLPVDNNSFEEIRGLYDMFNRLLGRIEEAQADLRQRSEVDLLTGLYNRRKFDELSAHEVNRSKRHAHVFTVMLIDLNKFKPVNDTYGHDAGDEILQQVSQSMMKNIRDEDVLARIGGDEFVVMLPETGMDEALTMIERFKVAIASAGIERDGELICVGSSIGAAIYPAEGETIDALMRVADQRMYEDKKR